MPLLSKFNALVFIVLLSAGLASCGKDDKDAAPATAFGSETGLLQYVADDSPYVFAMLEPLPEDVMDKVEPQLDVTLKAYRQLIRGALRESIDSDESADDAEIAKKEHLAEVMDELSGLFSLDGMREAGIGRASTAVIYGAGMLPVMRLSLTDAAAFEAAMRRVEEKSGKSMSVATIDDQTYRYAGDDKGRVIVALVGNDLVVSLVPAGLSDDKLREVLGLSPPANSLAGSGSLQSLAARYGFTGHGAGYVDFERLIAAFIDDPSGINGELLEAMEYDNDVLSPICKSEIRGMASVAPRLVTGYTDISAKRFASNSIIELRKDIADGLATLTAPVPGMGHDQGGLFSLGMSLDLLAAREFYAARLDALEKVPYECEHFAALQAGLAQGRQMLSQPAPPVVNGLKGFLAVVENIEGLDVARKQPPTSIDMRFLLATDNAPGLLAMGSMFSPELAAMKLQADGKPVRFNSPQLQAPVEVAFLAMNDGALALSVGEGTENGLSGMLAAKAGDPPPFMSLQMDAGRYYTFIGDAVMANQSDSAESSPEMNQAIRDLMQGIGTLINRFSMNVNFTDRGIEIPAEMTLAD